MTLTRVNALGQWRLQRTLLESGVSEKFCSTLAARRSPQWDGSGSDA